MVVLCNICAIYFWFCRLMKWRCRSHFQWGGCTKHVMLANVCDDTYDAAGQYSSIFDQLILNLKKCKERHDLTQLDILNLLSCWLCRLVALPPLSFLQWYRNLSRSPSPTSWNLWRPWSIRNMWAFFNNAEQCLMLVNKFKLNETWIWMISGVQTLGILLVSFGMWISVFF